MKFNNSFRGRCVTANTILDSSDYATGIFTVNEALIGRLRGTHWPFSNGFVMSATGGNISNIGVYRYHTFANTGVFNVTSVTSNGMNVEYIVVGGGGGSGRGIGVGFASGGGAGGANANSFVVSTATNFTVTVGAGGTAGQPSTSGASSNIFYTSNGTILASGIGGGAGGHCANSIGSPGGSGGGGYSGLVAFTLDLLVIGAGGGGAGYGGGGSGGLVWKTELPLISSGNYPIVVGTGSPAVNGGDSCALGYRGLGGGIQSTPGGSGGGSGSVGGGGVGTGLQPGSASGGFGNPGFGSPPGSLSSGGRGGGTGVDGFNGRQICITGANLYYGGGGGQGRPPPQGGGGGPGGLGGGGNGGGASTTATPGTDGTGGGGGGLGSEPSTRGGNGIVIIAYLGPQIATGGTVNTTGRSGYTVHCFANSGTFVFGGGAGIPIGSGGFGTGLQGYPGASAVLANPVRSGGGGGATQEGYGGNGGNGCIWFNRIAYAGGGAAQNTPQCSCFIGGIGGGGSTNLQGNVNTGGGGGANNNGGSGVVILRYRYR